MNLLFLTGASSGIGQALAQRYLWQGWRVAMVTRNPQKLQHWCETHYFPKDSYVVFQADVCDAAAMRSASTQCMERYGVPHVVIACAGISAGVDTAQSGDIDVMRRIYETNNIGMMATFQPFITGFKQRKTGCLVGIASVAGIRGLSGHGAYCSSKAAVISYCESLRLEMREATGPKGVRVVTLLPGFVDTPMTRENPFSMPFMLSADDFAVIAQRIITKGRSYSVVPWQMSIVAKLMRCMPNPLFDRIFAARERKPRQA